MRKVTFSKLVCVCTGLISSIVAEAQWTATVLTPGAARGAFAFGTDGTVQVGSVDIGTARYAALWRGNAATVENLSPGGSDSMIFGAGYGQQVGYGWYVKHASLWRGTAASWIDLNPTGSSQSVAIGTSGAQQVGYALLQNVHAGLWTGSAASWVDLHPAGASRSSAVAVHDGQQVGYAVFGIPQYASLWTGNAASWVNLNPFGSTRSTAMGVYGGRQVGSATFNNVTMAGMWSGTADSWVSLDPTNGNDSEAVAIHGEYQVGKAETGGKTRASLWHGTAASWEDLSLCLDSTWSDTRATGVFVSDSTIYVTGYGQNRATFHTEALLWTRPVPEPSTLAVSAFAVALLARIRRRSPVNS